MSVRQTLREKPAVGVAVAIAFVAIAVGFTVYQWTSQHEDWTPPQRVFFSVDDGKTWFVDDYNKVPPIEHDGKQAYRAYVFRCHDKEFVGYLERYTPDAQKVILEVRSKPLSTTGAPDSAAMDAATRGREVKRPGDQKWMSCANPREVIPITSPKCPHGGDNTAKPEPVEP
jgi:hypothetical protein